MSSQRARLFLHAAQAAPARLPEAIRLAVRMALLKDLLSFSAAIGTVQNVFKGGCIASKLKLVTRKCTFASDNKNVPFALSTNNLYLLYFFQIWIVLHILPPQNLRLDFEGTNIRKVGIVRSYYCPDFVNGIELVPVRLLEAVGLRFEVRTLPVAPL